MAQGVMRKYEGLFLADSAAATSSWDGIMATVNTIMSRAGAEVLSLEKWDDRRLCYSIEGRNRGCYLLSYFNADPSRVKGIERDVQISDDLLRVMILRADQIPEEIQAIPTPAMLAAKQAKETADRRAQNQQEGQEREGSVTDEFAADLEDEDIDVDLDETV